MMRAISFCAVIVSLATTAADAAIIATFSYGGFLQSGSVLNQYTQNITGFRIDLVPDSGSPASPIWELPPIGALGSPAGTFTNSPHPQGAFTVSWTGLNVVSGSSFVYSGLDYGGWNGVFVDEGLAPNLRGDEVVTVFFAGGASVSATLPAGNPGGGGVLAFDSSNLDSAIPEPSSLALLGASAVGLIAARRRKKKAEQPAA